MQFNIAIFTYAIAGKGKGLTVANEIGRILSSKGISCQIYNGDWPVSLVGFSDIWIAGGDGTLNYFINLYKDISIPISIFKGGTGNDFAWELYGNISLKQQVEFVLGAKPKPVDAILCNDRLFLNGTGIGFEGEVLKGMGMIRFLGGHLGYYLMVLKNILFFREKHFRVFDDKLIFEGRLLLVMVNNSKRTGGGFMVSPASDINDGLLDLVIARPLGILKRLFYLPKVQHGTHLALPMVTHIPGKHFTIECNNKLYAQVDGELMCAKTFRFSVLKDKYLFRY